MAKLIQTYFDIKAWMWNVLSLYAVAWKLMRSLRPKMKRRAKKLGVHGLGVIPANKPNFFLNWAIPGLFFLYFRLFNTIDSTYKFCRWLDSNRGLLVLEVTTLPTEPQPPINLTCHCLFSSPLIVITSVIITSITLCLYNQCHYNFCLYY